MSHFLIIGQKFSSLTDYLLEHGHEYTLLQDVLKTKYPGKKFKRRVLADFTSRGTALAALKNVTAAIDGVIATYENYVLPAAWIAEELGLPGMPVAAAEACTDKTIMRARFLDASEQVSPAFAKVTSREQLVNFANSHEFPLILKPANLSKSLLVTKNHNTAELLKNYEKSINLLGSTYKKYAPNRDPALIVEEFLEGSIHSVDAFVDQTGEPHVLEEVVDYQTGYDIGYDDNFHYSRLLPTKLTASHVAAIRHCASVGIRALNMKSSPAHVEIILTAQGPRIVEIGARNGGYRERMHSTANGIDITGAAVTIASGKIPMIKSTKHSPCAVLELFPRHEGIFDGLTNEVALRELPSLNYISIKPRLGDIVGKSSDGYKMCAVVILSNEDTAQFKADLAYVRESVSVVVRTD